MNASIRLAIFRIGGALLVTLGVLHLAVTPIIAGLVTRSTTRAAGTWLLPPMLLNHVVVGLLLLPIGAITFYAAPHAARGERWALTVNRISAVGVALLPVALFALMGRQYFQAVPFLIATAITCVACVVLLAAAFWPAAADRPR
jgi:xanthine/uracil permease